MGVDLTIAPERWPQLQDKHGIVPLTHTRIDFNGRWYDLWDELERVAIEAPEGIEWYDDEGLSVLKSNAYGNPITYVSAEELVRLAEPFVDQFSEWDRGLLAFVRELPPDRRIYLYFH